jgi:hypothetical protein
MSGQLMGTARLLTLWCSRDVLALGIRGLFGAFLRLDLCCNVLDDRKTFESLTWL